MFHTLTLNPSMDAIYSVPRLTSGVVHRVHEPILHAGGKGINVARHLCRLAGREVVRAHCILGRATGFRMQQLLEREGIELVVTSCDAETRTNVLIRELRGSREFKLNTPGPRIGRKVMDQCIARFLESLRPDDVAIVSGSLPSGASPKILRRIVAGAHNEGAQVWLDAEGEALRSALRASPHGLKPNREEFQNLTGVDPGRSSRSAILAAAREIIGRFRASEILLSLGARGAMLITSDCEIVETPAKVARTSHAVGAGDALLAAWLHAGTKRIGKGTQLARAMRYVEREVL